MAALWERCHLNRRRAYIGLLGSGVFPGEDFSAWELIRFQSPSLDKLRDWLNFMLRNSLISSSVGKVQCVSLTLVLGPKCVSSIGHV